MCTSEETDKHFNKIEGELHIKIPDVMTCLKSSSNAGSVKYKSDTENLIILEIFKKQQSAVI